MVTDFLLPLTNLKTLWREVAEGIVQEERTFYIEVPIEGRGAFLAKAFSCLLMVHAMHSMSLKLSEAVFESARALLDSFLADEAVEVADCQGLKSVKIERIFLQGFQK